MSLRPQSVLLEERASIIDAIRRHLEERREIIWAHLHGSLIEGMLFLPFARRYLWEVLSA